MGGGLKVARKAEGGKLETFQPSEPILPSSLPYHWLVIRETWKGGRKEGWKVVRKAGRWLGRLS